MSENEIQTNGVDKEALQNLKEGKVGNPYKRYISMPILVYGRPMTLGEYNKYRGWTIPENEDPNKEGYLINYSNSEFKGWSSKEPFETEHKLLKDMDEDF